MKIIPASELWKMESEFPWIDVKECLPGCDPEDDVLYAVMIHDGDMVNIAFWKAKTGRFLTWKDRDITDFVVAWAPYPPKPKWLRRNETSA